MTPNQTELLCPNCAGQCSYSPKSQGLECASCGETRPITVDPNVDPAREFHYHPDLPHTEQELHTQDVTHQCQTCGGAVVFVGPVVSERCPYCDGPIVLAEQDISYQTVGMIPFNIDEETAQANTLNWVTKRRAAPNDLAVRIQDGRVAGIYVPFWTFDSAEAIEYMVKYRVKRGKNWVTRSMSGAMRTQFDDLLMPASPHVTPLIRDGILHDFDPDALRPYTPSYLAGFAAEKHHVSVKEGLEASDRDKDLLIRNRIRSHSGKSRITHVSYKTDTTGIRYRRILLPVWVQHYEYSGKPMKVVTCGIHGRTFGERPFSTIKLFGYAFALSAAAVVVGWIWGVSGVF